MDKIYGLDRRDCNTDTDCMEIGGRHFCDYNPDCHGIAYYTTRTNQGLKMCLSDEVMDKPDGWRTMLKRGIYELVYKQSVQTTNEFF